MATFTLAGKSLMFPPWRFKLREAQAALDDGRLEEAARIAGDADLQPFLPIRQVLGEIAEQLARRGFERAAAGDLPAAWRDLEESRSIAGETAEWQRLQQAVADVATADIVQRLQAGDYAGAIERIELLEKRRIPGLPLQSLLEVSRRLVSARKLAQKGWFVGAADQLALALSLRPDLKLLAELQQTYRERGEQSRTLQVELHGAMAASDWTKVLAVANQLLELSPEQSLARDARKKAWAEVGERIGDSRRLAETQHWTTTPDRERDASAARLAGAAGELAAPARRTTRFMLWIDGVGGYLVCLGDEVVLGQAVPLTQVEVPIQADISRKHAKICRRGEGYVLEPLGNTVVLDGKPVAGPTLLSDGDEFLLGESVKLRFRKPHVLSASARLEMLSPHRTQPFADAVILMAESCVLGPKWQNHVVCRDWEGDVVLYRSDKNIMCRAMESIEIDGKLHDGRGPVTPGSQVLGSDFSLTLEAL